MKTRVGWYGWVAVADPKKYGCWYNDPQGKAPQGTVGVCVAELVSAGDARRYHSVEVPVTVADDTVMLSLRSGRFKDADLMCFPTDFTPDPRALEMVGGHESVDWAQDIAEVRARMPTEGWQE